MSWSKGKLQTNPLNLQAGFELSTVTTLAVKADPEGPEKKPKKRCYPLPKKYITAHKASLPDAPWAGRSQELESWPRRQELLKILQIQTDEEEDQQPEPQERALWSWPGARARVPGSFVTLRPLRGGRDVDKGSSRKE